MSRMIFTTASYVYILTVLAYGSDVVVLDCPCPDWDLLIEIQSAMKRMPLVMLQCFIGHKDNTMSYCSLPLLGQLNINVDKLAGN
jgi:hypothetical protein